MPGEKALEGVNGQKQEAQWLSHHTVCGRSRYEEPVCFCFQIPPAPDLLQARLLNPLGASPQYPAVGLRVICALPRLAERRTAAQKGKTKACMATHPGHVAIYL